MLRIGNTIFPQPDTFKTPQTDLDYALKEVQGGVSFSEASFFRGAGEIAYGSLTEANKDIFVKIQNDFFPVDIDFSGMDYKGTAILRIDYEEIREFPGYYSAKILFQPVQLSAEKGLRFFQLAFKTETRTVVQPIQGMAMSRTLGGSATCNLILDSVSGEFDPDNPKVESWVKQEGKGSLDVMKYRVSEDGEGTYIGNLPLVNGIIDNIDPSGYAGAGKDQVTFRMSDKMNHMPYIKYLSPLYEDGQSRDILTDTLSAAGIGGTFSGGISVPELQFVDTSYQNAINMLLQAEFAAGCIDGSGNFRIFSLATDQVHHIIPQIMIDDIKASYGKSSPITTVRVTIKPTESSTTIGAEEIVTVIEADAVGVVKITVPYSETEQIIMTSPQLEPLEGHEGIVSYSIINKGDRAEILITALSTGGHYKLNLKAKQVQEGDSGFEVLYTDAALEELYGGRIEKRISNYVVQDATAALNLARNYLTLENWKRITYNVPLCGFMDLYPGQTVKFKHTKFGHDVHLLLKVVKHSWKPNDGLKTSFTGWKVGDFYV